MSGLRIYGIARTRAYRALWMAMELGLDYQHLPIEIGDAGARSPEFLAINPNGRLPVIVDDGFVLFESLAITLYLAKKHGKLYPATREGEARAWQWSFWSIAEVDRGVNIWSLHAVRLPPQERASQDEGLRPHGEERVFARLEPWQRRKRKRLSEPESALRVSIRISNSQFRHCEERSDEAIHGLDAALDCFA